MGQLARNVVSLYVARVAAVAVAVFLFPFIAHHVGLTHYGIWLLITSVTVFFVQADFGMGTSAIRYVSQAHAQRQPARVNEIVSSTVAFFAGLGAASGTVLVLVFAAFWGSFNIPDADRDLAAWMIAIVVVLNFLVGLPLGVFRQTLVGLQRMDLANRLLLGQALLRLAVIVTVLELGAGIIGVAVAESAIGLALGLAALVLCRRAAPELRVRRAHVSASMLRSMAPYSLQIFAMGIAALVILQTNNVVIGLFLPIASVTLFAGAWRVYFVCRDITGALLNAVVPDASHAAAVGNASRLRDILVRGTKYGNAVILAVAVPAMVFAEPLLVTWLGDRFAEVAVVVQILLGSLLINNNHLVAVGMLTGVGRVSRITRYHVIWALANVIIAVALIDPLGLPGVALGIALPLLVLEPFYIRAATREFDVPLRRFLVDAVGRPYAAAAAAALVLAGIVVGLNPSEPIPVLAATAAYLAVFAAAFLTFGVDGEERRKLLPLGRRSPRTGGEPPMAARGSAAP